MNYVKLFESALIENKNKPEGERWIIRTLRDMVSYLKPWHGAGEAMLKDTQAKVDFGIAYKRVFKVASRKDRRLSIQSKVVQS